MYQNENDNITMRDYKKDRATASRLNLRNKLRDSRKIPTIAALLCVVLIAGFTLHLTNSSKVITKPVHEVIIPLEIL